MSSFSEGQIHQLAEALQREGYTPTDVTKLGQTAREHLGPVRGTHCIIEIKKSSVPSFLECLGTRLVLATTAPFVAKDHFIEDTSHSAKVRIVYLDRNFKTWFLGKTEGAKCETALRYAKLTGNELDKSILDELGDKAETSLAEMFAVMEAQADGKAGDLLVDSYANTFFIRDITGTLRAVRVDWYGNGWRVFARSVYSFGWNGCRRLFSRNS